MISRRQFLRGDLSGRSAAGPASDGIGGITIAATCLAQANAVCRSCGDACEAGAIRFRPRLGGAALPEIDAEKCTRCGDCIAPCPVGAVSLRPGSNEIAAQAKK